jgi:DNA-binding HxlR family transcriptional regulator
MYDYGEACPISKATTVLCERWTLQILREMMLGATRFSELQRMLPKISPSLLNSRLRQLAEHEIIVKKRIPEQRGSEYHLTPAGKSLQPVLMELGKWGMRWIFDGMDEPQLDVAVLLGHMAAVLNADELPSCETVIQFTFEDLDDSAQRFMFIKEDKREVCDENPGHEVDVYLRSTFKTIAGIWWGDLDVRAAVANGSLKVVGPSVYTKSLPRWFPVSQFAGENPRRGELSARSVLGVAQNC